MIGEIFVWLGVAAVALTAWMLYLSTPQGDEDEQTERQRIDD